MKTFQLNLKSSDQIWSVSVLVLVSCQTLTRPPASLSANRIPSPAQQLLSPAPHQLISSPVCLLWGSSSLSASCSPVRFDLDLQANVLKSSPRRRRRSTHQGVMKTAATGETCRCFQTQSFKTLPDCKLQRDAYRGRVKYTLRVLILTTLMSWIYKLFHQWKNKLICVWSWTVAGSATCKHTVEILHSKLKSCLFPADDKVWDVS